MCRNDRGWRKLSPALTESGKVLSLKKVRWFENQISQVTIMKNEELNGNRKICGR